MYEKRMKKTDGGYGTKRKKKNMGGKSRMMYNEGGMPKGKPC